MDEIITLDYGSGGKKTARLIESMIVPALSNPALDALGDGAILPGAEKLVFSTDSFVVSPLFFPGGDIGKLSVCGTVNDVAVCGGVPKFLSCAFLIEEGFATGELSRIIDSIRTAAEKAGVTVVTGDTKVVERGRGDGIYINTAGIGFLQYPGLSPANIRPGDDVIVSGTGPFLGEDRLPDCDRSFGPERPLRRHFRHRLRRARAARPYARRRRDDAV